LNDRAQRRLAAIVAADVAGYSRLVGLDEEGTLRALRSHRAELIDHLLIEHGGRVANTAGDSLLLEFPSAVDAVRFAVAMQEGIAGRNRDVPAERRLEFRIGINVGDVVADGPDLLGDGVNVAARLEALAVPGGICLSRSARDQVRDRLDLPMQDLGEVEVKNITRRVRVFAIHPDGPAAVPVARQSGVKGPKVTVLSFDSYAADQGSVDLARGFTDDVVTELCKFEHLFVVGPVMPDPISGAKPSVQEVGRITNADYVLTGNLRTAGGNIRLVVNLVDARTGKQTWSEKFDRLLHPEKYFEMQDEVVGKIVAVIASEFGVLTAARYSEARGRPPKSLAAYECVLQAQRFFSTFQPEDFQPTRECLLNTVEREPDYAMAWAWLGGLLQEQVAQAFDPRQVDSLDQARRAIDRALELAPTSQIAHLFLVEDHFHRRNLDQAIRAADHTIQLNPQNVGIVVTMGFFIALSGDCERGTAIIRKTEEISPYLPPWRHFAPAVCHFGELKYAEALHELDKISIPFPHGMMLRVACLGHVGQHSEAMRTLKQITSMRPDALDVWVGMAKYWYEDAWIDDVMAGLRKAGIMRPTT
jgi:adenylate cyclase